MITLDEFRTLVNEQLNRDLLANPAQNSSVSHDGDEILVVVAGPGSGKTTVLVLRALKHVLVDNILPENILITTFTRKAAKELRTRWLDWGTELISTLQNREQLEIPLGRIDLNRCRIDTLDSLTQQALTENRLPGEIAPIVAEKAAAKLILKRNSFRDIYTNHKATLDSHFLRYAFPWVRFLNQGEALSTAQDICDRLVQDLVDIDEFRQSSQENDLVGEILQRHLARMEETDIFDFAGLEARMLTRIRNGMLQNWASEIRSLLIDEYQDTNPLQESIYFSIIRSSNPLVTVVGDDDQSMYRFRGGSVELFTGFRERCLAVTGRKSIRVDMVTNYRSSEEIVDFYNSHLTGDPAFSNARILPSKPEVVSERGVIDMPVLGLFAPGPEVLAERLSIWLSNLINNRSIQIQTLQGERELSLSESGNLGDCVLLSYSLEEVRFNRYNQAAEHRFPSFLRQEMARRNHQTFNPRGLKLRTVANVQRLLGLLLLCVDPTGQIWTNMYPTREATFFLSAWTTAANELIAENPSPNDGGGINTFVDRWHHASLGINNDDFPDEWPVLRLLFKLITWIPEFQNDPEHQVWLEAITRVISSAGMASAYGMQLLKTGDHRARSRQSFIRDALFAIAEDEVEVDEDIMPSVPRTTLQLMTIHQSKGLEFPLVIVDVGSQFKTNSQRNAFRRFPIDDSNVAIMEDDVEPFLQSPLRGGRPPRDRSFDDLVRLYYVAFSRPKSVLMLVGHENCLKYGTGPQLKGAIPNIAMGWNRDSTWPWRQPFPGRRPPIQVEPPLVLI